MVARNVREQLRAAVQPELARGGRGRAHRLRELFGGRGAKTAGMPARRMVRVGRLAPMWPPKE